jgi:hypothetical protein
LGDQDGQGLHAGRVRSRAVRVPSEGRPARRGALSGRAR